MDRVPRGVVRVASEDGNDSIGRIGDDGHSASVPFYKLKGHFAAVLFNEKLLHARSQGLFKVESRFVDVNKLRGLARISINTFLFDERREHRLRITV
jgi:hypothetical protein